MLTNYIKIAFRNLQKNKGFTAINIIGLAIGMASSFLIMLWVYNQISYDRIYKKTDQLYVVGNKGILDGITRVYFSTPKPFAPAASGAFPEIASISRLEFSKNFLMTVDEKKFKPGNGGFVDQSFIEMFDLPLLSGDKTTILKSPSEIVLTEKLAKSIFGSTDVVGKMIRIDSTEMLSVSGVLKDIPSNSRFRNHNYFLSWKFLEKIGWSDKNWGNNSTQTFIELNEGVNFIDFQNKIKGFYQQHGDTKNEVYLQAISQSWLYNKFENGIAIGGRVDLVIIFLSIAGIILLIACINFMNLSTAQSERRAKEVGVRKVVGATKSSLVAQFLVEALIMSFIASFIAVILVLIILPYFNDLIGTQLSFNLKSPYLWISLFLFSLFTGVLAGSYPAFFLSSFKPTRILKGGFQKIAGGMNARKILVVFQFTMAVVFILISIIAAKQIQHGLHRESGFDKEKLIYTNDDGDLKKNYSKIKKELLDQGIATSVSRSKSPITENWSGNTMEWEGKPIDNTTQFNRISTDEDLITTFGLTLINGRDFDLQKFPTDSAAMILNESAAKEMNFKNPIGQIVHDEGRDWHIIGVVKDYIQESPFGSITPMVIEGAYGWSAFTNIRFHPQLATQEALKKTEDIFRKYNPDYPFEFKFVDEAYAQKFEETKTFGLLANLFTGLTIFISCLGLFGLSAYMAENRTKEIGIRKVLGASILSVTNLLSKEFIYLILISCVVAFPIAYWLMDKFLSKFDYKTDISWNIFFITGLSAIFIAILSVSYQSIKAALANPVNSLRDE